MHDMHIHPLQKTLVNGMWVTKRREGDRKQETKRHTQAAGPIKPHRPTQNTAEAEKAAQDHKPIGTKKCNNHAQHNPEQTRPPKKTLVNGVRIAL
jgi:hypothetical protein